MGVFACVYAGSHVQKPLREVSHGEAFETAPRTLADLVSEQAARTPDAIAVVYEGAAHTLLLGPLWRFNLDFQVQNPRGKVTGYKNLSALRARVAPVVLRRRKEEVREKWV